MRVIDGNGKPVFEADALGPLVFVNLPQGLYTVAATSRGRTNQPSVSLGAKTQTAIPSSW